MNFQISKTNSHCVGRKHYSGTKIIVGEVTYKKTDREIKLLDAKCLICHRTKSMMLSDNTIQAEGLSDFFENLGKIGLNVSKKMAKNLLKNPGRALDITANIATAAASRNPKNVMSTLPELITFYNTGKGLYLGQNLYISCYLNGTKKCQITPISTTRKG